MLPSKTSHKTHKDDWEMTINSEQMKKKQMAQAEAQHHAENSTVDGNPARPQKNLAQVAGQVLQEAYDNKHTPEYEAYKKKDMQEHSSVFSWPLLDEERFVARENERAAAKK